MLHFIERNTNTAVLQNAAERIAETSVLHSAKCPFEKMRIALNVVSYQMLYIVLVHVLTRHATAIAIHPIPLRTIQSKPIRWFYTWVRDSQQLESR